MDVLRLAGDADMGEDGAALLCQPGHVEHAAALALEMGGHADQRADGDDAGAADAGDQDAIGLLQRRQRGLRQHRPGGRPDRRALALAQAAALDGDEARAEALEAGEVLVAGRLVDRPLAAELGLDRHHRQAVRLRPAIAAALAHRLVDHHPLLRIHHQAALAPPPLLGGASLVIDHHADPGNLAQLALHRIEIVAVMHRHAGGEAAGGGVFVRLVGDHDDLLDDFGIELPGQAQHVERAVDRLAAGHRHRVVVEELVSDVDPGGDRRADRQAAGMVVGAVADVLEDVVGLAERRLADPAGAFAAHLGEGLGVAVHPQRHVMAADAGQRPAALGHLGRAVVRAAGAEIGDAAQRRRIAGERLLLGLEEGEPLADARAVMEAGDAPGDDAGDARRGQLVGRGQDPFAGLVELADDPRPDILAPVIELLLQLVLDQRPLLLDDQDLLEPFGEVADAVALQRPGHALVDAEIVERLADVEIGLAAGDDAEAPPRAVDDDAVQAVGPGIGERGVELVAVQPELHLERLGRGQRRGRLADVEAALRHGEIGRDDDLDAVRVDQYGGRAVNGVGHHLEGDPAARIARHRPAMQAEIEEFLHAGGVQHRDAEVHEGVFGLVRRGRGFAGMVVAGQQQHAAMLRGAGEISVAEDVAGAVHARPLAVPHGEDAIVLRVAEQLDLLAAPDRGGRQVLVDPRLEHDLVLLEEALRLPHRLVDAAERRAAIAGDEAGGVEAGGLVALALHHRQADERLGPGQEDPTGFQHVFVVQGDGRERHRRFSQGAPAQPIDFSLR